MAAEYPSKVSAAVSEFLRASLTFPQVVGAIQEHFAKLEVSLANRELTHGANDGMATKGGAST